MDKIKIQKEYPDFCAEVDGLSAEYLESRLVDLQVQLQESEEHKAENEALIEARAAVDL